MACVKHVLFGTVWIAKFIEAVYTLSSLDYFLNISYESIKIDALIFERREGMIVHNMCLGKNVWAEGTNLIDSLFINQFKF